MRLGIDSFSVRSQGWDAFQIIEYAASLGLENVHFSERAHLGGLDPDNLRAIRDHASSRGQTIEIGMRSINRLAGTFDASLGSGEQQLGDMIDAALVIGSPIVRCFVGMQSDRNGEFPFADFVDETVRTLRAAAPRAEKTGITIAVENHGGVDFLAPELRDLIEAVNSAHVRVCFDSGNPVYAAEDPVYAAELLAPYVVTTHLRDTRAWLTDYGAMVQWVPAGQGTVDLGRVVSILREQAPEAPIDLEVITGGPPRHIPYFEEQSEFWTMYPQMTAQSFARFLATARSEERGAFEQLIPEPGVQPSLEFDAALRQQQLDHFAESVRYSKDVLGLGIATEQAGERQ